MDQDCQKCRELQSRLAECEKDVKYWKGSWKSYSEMYSVEKGGRLRAEEKLAAAEAILTKTRAITHIPVSYETGMGGANNSPCIADCPGCGFEAWRKGRG